MARLAQAKNAEFETWAALAGTPVVVGGTAVPILANWGDDEDDNYDDDKKDSNEGKDSDSDDDD